MTKTKRFLASLAVTMLLASPAAAYSDEVALAAIDHRIEAIHREMAPLLAQFVHADPARRAVIGHRLLQLGTRKALLYKGRYKVLHSPEKANAHILAWLCINIASPA